MLGFAQRIVKYVNILKLWSELIDKQVRYRINFLWYWYEVCYEFANLSKVGKISRNQVSAMLHKTL